MSMRINRRQFILGLISLGAPLVIPVSADAVTVDRIWTEALRDPWHFEVDEYGTILEADAPRLETWGEMFDTSTDGIRTAAEVIRVIRENEISIGHFQELARSELENLRDELEGEPPPDARRMRYLKRLVEALEDEDDGWETWIEMEGRGGVVRFKAEIENWMTLPIDWLQSDFFPIDFGPYGKALTFFRDMPSELLAELGVAVVEGEHPGSSYFAAELRMGIDFANAKAEALGMPFRFLQTWSGRAA